MKALGLFLGALVAAAILWGSAGVVFMLGTRGIDFLPDMSWHEGWHLAIILSTIGVLVRSTRSSKN